MKQCQPFEEQLVAYLHGELSKRDIQAMEAHLESCDACRVEMDAHRATLDILDEALVAAPAPERLSGRRSLPRSHDFKRNNFEHVWFSPQLKAALSSGVFFSIFFLLSGLFVVFEVISREPKCFSPPSAISRPKMKLRKPQVRVRKSSKPTASLSRRMVTPMKRTRMPDIQLPEMSGVAGGLVTVTGGFDMMPHITEVTVVGSASTLPGDREMNDGLRAGRDQSMVLSEESDDHFSGFARSGPAAEARQEELPKSDLGQIVMEDLESEEIVRELKPAVFNPYVLASENAFSTFSIDVDTASYGLARQQLLDGQLPEIETVRTEEFINSFDYDYRPPSGKQTFAIHNEMAPSPFRTGMDVLKIGIKGRRIGRDDHRNAVLTLVIDTSGSMATPERMGLIKQSVALLLDQLNPDDQVAIVQFGGEARLALEHTAITEKAEILEAINSLQPGGPTQFDKGLELGYQLAMNGFSAGDSNRIMIMSDGVANLGELDPEAILEQVAEQRRKGIYLSVLGFGAGTYDDDMLERLANNGDGMYAYIDTLDESRRLLVDQLAATLHVIASDVKIQVEFNPARVLRYRQLGYENRQLTKEQFRDDTVDAGEVGSGQSVTALYDVELNPDGPENEPVATVYVRYRRADNGAIEEISSRVTEQVRRKRFVDTNERFQLAVCAAEFAERLRRNPYTDGTEMKEIAVKLQPVILGLDLDEQVKELSELISIAEGLE